MKDLRYDTRLYDAGYVLQRVLKLRELYRLVDSRRASRPGSTFGVHPQVCVVELANLIGNLGRHVIPHDEYKRPVVSATALLAYVANEVLRAQGQSDDRLTNEKDVEGWFVDNPVSIEQAIEMLAAVASILAYRQAAQLRPTSQAETERPTGQLDHFATILRIERRLRILVRDFYDSKFGLGEETHRRIRQHLGEGVYLRAIDKMAKTRQAQPTISLELLDFLYLRELTRLLFREWDLLPKGVFPDKNWLATRLDMIADVRNETAHARPVDAAGKALAVRYCQELSRAIEAMTGLIRRGEAP